MTYDIQNIEVDKQVQRYVMEGGKMLGPYSTHLWRTDPKHLAFTLARYLQVAKLFGKRGMLMEVGCGDALGSELVKAETGALIFAIDIAPSVIYDAEKRLQDNNKIEWGVYDFLNNSPERTRFDGVYCLDVIEHIPASQNDQFFRCLSCVVREGAMIIVGTPNVTAKDYASEVSRKTHVNLQSAASLEIYMRRICRTVMMFGMNDTTLHTGYLNMAHYLLAVGVQ